MNLLNHHLAGRFVASFASGVDAGDWFRRVFKMFRGTAFDDLEIPIVQNVSDGISSVGIWMEHPKEEPFHSTVVETLKHGTTIGCFVVRHQAIRVGFKESFPSSNESGVVRILDVGRRPRVSTVVKRQVNNGTRPNVQWSGIVVTCS